jgi:hypothetical protein
MDPYDWTIVYLRVAADSSAPCQTWNKVKLNKLPKRKMHLALKPTLFLVRSWVCFVENKSNHRRILNNDYCCFALQDI